MNLSHSIHLPPEIEVLDFFGEGRRSYVNKARYGGIDSVIKLYMACFLGNIKIESAWHDSLSKNFTCFMVY